MPIATNVVSLNPFHGEMYSIQHYVIKFVSDLRQFGGYLRVLPFPPPIKLTANIVENGIKYQINPFDSSQHICYFFQVLMDSLNDVHSTRKMVLNLLNGDVF